MQNIQHNLLAHNHLLLAAQKPGNLPHPKQHDPERCTHCQSKVAEEKKQLTPLALLDLEGEVQRADGEVDGLRVHASNLTQQVHDQFALMANHARQDLGNPESNKRQLVRSQQAHDQFALIANHAL